MPQITNTFLKSKMNKDLDARILPNGEYRDAQNLQISRSQGAEVGEFENVLGNTELKYLYTGRAGSTYYGKIIGQFTDPPNSNIYIFSAGYSGDGRCPRDLKVYADPCGVVDQTVIQIFDAAGNQLNPATIGIEVGMMLWGDNWDSQPSGAGGQEVDPIVTNVSGVAPNYYVTLSQPVSFAATPGCPGPGTPPGDTINIGYTNTIHRYNVDNDTLTLLVRGSFLNFHQDYRMYATNMIEDLLFWTDNRNQPRRINVNLANPLDLISPIHYLNEDQISVAQYYPYNTPLVLHQVIQECTGGNQAVAPAKGYELTMTDITGIQIGDIVTGFPNQGPQELWNVISIDPGVLPAGRVIIYNNFRDGSAGQVPGTYAGTTVNITFSNTTMRNEFERKLTRGFDSSIVGAATYAAYTDVTFTYNYDNQTSEPSAQPTPRVGDYITSEEAEITGSGTGRITVDDKVVIQQVTSITPGTSVVLQLTKSIDTLVGSSAMTVSANPNYNVDFTGDPDLVEKKFIRFSYRFKYENNEYSLAAPYTQLCFIPKHDGYFGGGKNDALQDQVNAYDSSIIEWFTNKIDTVSLKIPLPPDNNATAADAIDSLINNYKVKEIEILYKESDALSTKILENIQVDNTLSAFVETIPTGIITTNQWYYNFDYKSIKPYRTFPTSEQNRVWDNVPLKALGQEITGNRVIYGNFLQKHTPPNSLDYEVINGNKDLDYDNYAQYPNHSVKQNRNYQVGWVLSDRYGRASSVVLSSNDDKPNVNGSTIYIPYKNWSEVDDPINDVTTYKWLGNALRVKLNNGITQITNNTITGEPGLYKSESDTTCDGITILGGGNGHVVGDILGFGYPPGPGGLGSGLTAEVVSETAGVITGLQVVDRGTGYANGQTLFQTSTTGGGTAAVVETIVYPANPTGWQSYKLVVKQQEQEYYNIYLPGYVNGYPVREAVDRGRVAFAVLLGDNINKVPRDLNEVGPLQTEFSASVRLFGRVNNPNINNLQKAGAGTYYYENREYAWNTQYFPGRINDESVTVGNVGSGGLELANSPFSNLNTSAGAFLNPTDPAANDGKVPWGRPGEYQNFYNVQQNPLATGLKIGAEESQPQLTQPNNPELNTLGAKVTKDSIPAAALTTGCMYPYLAVSETEAVESQLEIFYESSTSGNLVDLNRQVISDYGGVSGTTTNFGAFLEDDAVGTNVITAFSFTDSAGNILTLQGLPTITQVIDGNGVDVTGIFTIVETVPATYDDFDIKTNQLFWYGAETVTKSNLFKISFQTVYDDGVNPVFVDNLNNQITIQLNNIAPTIGGFTPAYGPDAGAEQVCSKPGGSSGYDTTTSGIWGQFTNGKNGSADITNDTQELCYELTVTPPGGTATFSIDQSGNVTKTGGTVVNGTYTFDLTLTDAAASCVTSPGSLSVTCSYDIVVGTPPVNQVLCFGPTAQLTNSANLDTSCLLGTGYPLEVFFGASRFVNSGIVGNAGALIGSGTQTILSTIDTAIGAGPNGYGVTSSNSLNLRYYNAFNEASSFGAFPWTCGLPPVTPAFTTGELVQGVFAIEAILSKTAFASPDNTYTTNFTILYRATAADPWQLATAAPSSPTNPGVAVGNYNLLTVVGTGASSASLTYHFAATGEYAVRNNGVRSVGCTACSTCARFEVNFYDATFGATAAPCVDCVGPL
tara:strand:- start:7262 stop:12259 length:4998 start_codon:yes stop_codon:yes gene_type:complete